MYRFSRAIFVEIKDLVDPHPETVSVPEGKRRVLQSCEATIERLARDPHYFAKPSQSLFQEIRRPRVVSICRINIRSWATEYSALEGTV